MIKPTGDPGQDILYSWTQLWSSGVPRSSLPLRYQYLELNLWQWRLVSKWYEVPPTNWEWSVWSCLGQPTFMVTTWVSSTTCRDQSWHWRRNQIWSASMPLESQWLWVKVWLVVSPLRRTLRMWQQRSSHLVSFVSIWFTSCCMTSMTSIRRQQLPILFQNLSYPPLCVGDVRKVRTIIGFGAYISLSTVSIAVPRDVLLSDSPKTKGGGHVRRVWTVSVV